MPKRIQLAEHLSSAELERRYRTCKESVERSHYHILWLLSSTNSVQEVARVTGYSQEWVRVIVKRYNHAGPDALGDTRHRNPGAVSLLTSKQLHLLEQALLSPPPDGGLWNGPKVAHWVSNLLGRKCIPNEVGNCWVNSTIACVALVPVTPVPMPSPRSSGIRKKTERGGGGCQTAPFQRDCRVVEL
jgi:hypothetical protein